MDRTPALRGNLSPGFSLLHHSEAWSHSRAHKLMLPHKLQAAADTHTHMHQLNCSLLDVIGTFLQRLRNVVLRY